MDLPLQMSVLAAESGMSRPQTLALSRHIYFLVLFVRHETDLIALKLFIAQASELDVVGDVHDLARKMGTFGKTRFSMKVRTEAKLEVVTSIASKSIINSN